MANEAHHDHDEHHHNWRLDTSAFKSTKMYNFTNLFDKNIKFLNSNITPLIFSLPKIEIDQKLFKEKMQMFSGALESEPGVFLKSRCGIKQITPAVDFLQKEYEGLGYTTKKQSVGLTKKYLNFVAIKKGTAENPKIIVVSSHIDSVCNAGANDNGSGTISAMMIAKAIKDIDLKHTVYFVGFDNEESGMRGSKKVADIMAKKYKDRFIANINIEMMATNSKKDKVFHVIDCDRDDSNYITDLFAANILKHGLSVKINEACTTRSDHSSFWNKKLPAVVISENFFGGDSDRCYHRKCDVVDERMDFGYMAEITKATAYTIIDLANK